MSLFPTPQDRARAAWGDEIPDWVLQLAEECGLTSQSKVAARMNRSSSVISQVLGRSYMGNYKAIEEVFHGVFNGLIVECPAIGEIPANVCRDWRLKSQSFASTNNRRVLMYRACNRCPRNGKGGDA